MDLTPDQYNTVTYLNPSSQDFQITYGGASYGFIPAGGTKKMPKFLADHILKHIVDQCMNIAGQNTNNIAERAQWESKIKISEEALVNAPQKTRQQLLQEELDRLNSVNAPTPTALELEEMARQKGRAEADNIAENLKAILPQSDEVPPQTTTPPDAPNLNNQIPTPTDTPVVPLVPLTPDNNGLTPNQNMAPIIPEPVVSIPGTPDSLPVDTASPTRNQLYDFARTQGILDMADPNTMNALENASIPELQNLVHWQS